MPAAERHVTQRLQENTERISRMADVITGTNTGMQQNKSKGMCKNYGFYGCKSSKFVFLIPGWETVKRAAKLRIKGKTETSQRSSNNKTKRRSF